MNSIRINVLSRALELLPVMARRVGRVRLTMIDECFAFIDGNLTFVLLNGIYTGWAKLNPIDGEGDLDVGINIALSRALRKFLAGVEVDEVL